MELRYIGDYCDHFTIIVLSLAKNDPPNSDLKKNYASIVSCTKLVIIFNKPPQILVIAEQGKYLLDKSTDVDNELIKTLNFQNQKYMSQVHLFSDQNLVADSLGKTSDNDRRRDF